MEKFIEIYEDIVPIGLQDRIEYFILESKRVNWTFDNNISGIKNTSSPGFSSQLFSARDNPPTPPISPNFFTLTQPLYSLCKFSNINLFDIFEARLFLQLPSPTPGPIMSGLHTDLSFPHWVCIYYVNDSDGDTIFFDDNKKEIKRVSPKRGRVVFFNGVIKHIGSNPTQLRSIINFNFIGEKL